MPVITIAARLMAGSAASGVVACARVNAGEPGGERGDEQQAGRPEGEVADAGGGVELVEGVRDRVPGAAPAHDRRRLPPNGRIEAAHGRRTSRVLVSQSCGGGVPCNRARHERSRRAVPTIVVSAPARIARPDEGWGEQPPRRRARDQQREHEPRPERHRERVWQQAQRAPPRGAIDGEAEARLPERGAEAVEPHGLPGRPCRHGRSDQRNGDQRVPCLRVVAARRAAQQQPGERDDQPGQQQRQQRREVDHDGEQPHEKPRPPLAAVAAHRARLYDGMQPTITLDPW